MANNRHEERGHDALAGFRKWQRERAAKARTSPSDDEFYAAWTSAASGEQAQKNAGVAHEQIDGGVRVPDSVTNDEIYAGFTDMLDGTAARKRAREDVRQDFLDRREEARRHAREMGTPLHPMYED